MLPPAASRLLTSAVLATTLTGCSASVGLEDSSPSQWGVGARLAPVVIEAEAVTLHGLAGVQRQWFDGGHDNVFTVGLQGRRLLRSAEPDGFWIGAEGAFHNWRVSDGDSDPVANVIGVSGLLGRPIGQGPLHLWGSAGLLFFSDFKSDGAMVYDGGTGWQINLGFELQDLFGSF